LTRDSGNSLPVARTLLSPPNADSAVGDKKAKQAAYIVDVLVNCEPGSAAGVGPAKAPRLLLAGTKGQPLVVPFPLEQVTSKPDGVSSPADICSAETASTFSEVLAPSHAHRAVNCSMCSAGSCSRLTGYKRLSLSARAQLAALSSLRMYVAKDLRQPEPRAAAVAQLAEVQRRFPSGPPVSAPPSLCSCGAGRLQASHEFWHLKGVAQPTRYCYWHVMGTGRLDHCLLDAEEAGRQRQGGQCVFDSHSNKNENSCTTLASVTIFSRCWTLRRIWAPAARRAALQRRAGRRRRRRACWRHTPWRPTPPFRSAWPRWP